MLFYTGTTLAAAMYIVGAVEIVLVRLYTQLSWRKLVYFLFIYLQQYMAPFLSLFDLTENDQAMYNNFRIYGTGLLMVMGLIVFLGVKFVNKFATVALACVIMSIIAIYVGIFYNWNGNDKLQ